MGILFEGRKDVCKSIFNLEQVEDFANSVRTPEDGHPVLSAPSWPPVELGCIVIDTDIAIGKLNLL